MSKKLTTKEFIEKAIAKHGAKYDYSQTDYVNSRDKVKIICADHGLFEQRASAHLSGNGCPECQKVWTDEHKQNLVKSSRCSRGFTTKQWIERVKKVHGDKYDYSLVEYVNQRTDVRIICPIHGEFLQKADSHMRGYGCKLCGFETETYKSADHTWSDSQRDKIENTCIKKYGAKRYLDSTEGRQKLVNVLGSKKHREKMSSIISSDAIQEKTKLTNLKKYGETSAMKLQETVDKVHESKMINKSWSTSKPEELMYDILLSAFGEKDVKRQYKSLLYPFRCDFYIISLDLYIELNATWLHGKHWYNDTSQDDIKLLQKWQRKVEDGRRFYQVAIDIWTVRDLKKRAIAIENKLNYLAFWNNDLSDFKEWLNGYKEGNIILNNII